MRRRPAAEWQVCGVCNYDCSYCIQSRSSRRGDPSEEAVEGMLRFFARLPGAWEVKMSGGEPFCSRRFLDRVVPGLVERTPHTVSVLTNLSAPMPALERFAAVARGRIGIVSASLHLESVRAEDFVRRAAAFRGMIGPEADFVVNAVLVPGRLAEVGEAKRLSEAAGLRFFPQVMKVKAPPGVHVYEGEDRRRVEEILGTGTSDPRLANTVPCYSGRLCRAGVEYFTVAQDGDAWSCRSARRAHEGFLGNALDGSFRLREAPERCRYPLCPCTVPANRGMIEGIRASGA